MDIPQTNRDGEQPNSHGERRTTETNDNLIATANYVTSERHPSLCCAGALQLRSLFGGVYREETREVLSHKTCEDCAGSIADRFRLALQQEIEYPP